MQLTTSQKVYRRLALALGLVLTIGLAVSYGLQRRKGASAIRRVLTGTKYAPLTELIVAQARHESNNFTSNVYKSLSNPFGMKVPSVRRFIGNAGAKAPDGGFYARYNSDAQATKDLVLWLDYTNFPETARSPELFAAALKNRGYYTDSLSNYTNAIKRWLQQP